MIFEFKNSKISAISGVVPSRTISLLDEKELYDGDVLKLQRVIESSGFLHRRVADKNVLTSDLCFQAAKDVIQKTYTNLEDIDALLFISYTPDYIMPATAYVLHKRLGLTNNCVVMDIPQACSGYILGLYQASMLLNAGCKKVLLLVGDTFSKFSDMFNNGTAPVFGDAGTATLLEFDSSAETSYFNINSDGSGYDALMCRAGAFREPPTEKSFYDNGAFKYHSNMDGGRIFEFTMSQVAPSIEKLLEHSGVDKKTIDYYVFHQANKFIIQNIARKLNLEHEKVPVGTMTQYGNQCGASIPCALIDMLHHKIKTQNNKMLLSGFGVGLSWASAILNINSIYCSEIQEYEVEHD